MQNTADETSLEYSELQVKKIIKQFHYQILYDLIQKLTSIEYFQTLNLYLKVSLASFSMLVQMTQGHKKPACIL